MAPGDGSPEPRADLRVYGRRRGRPMRPGRRRLLETVLPRLRVALPDDERLLIDPRALFSPPPTAVWVEVGFGAGEHLVWQAQAHPEVGFIGCEPYLGGVARLLAEVDARGLTNIRVVTDDARRLLPRLPEASLDRVFVLFPDPWPKTRHHKRRFVSTATATELGRALRDGGELRLATDHAGYARWMLAHLLPHPAFSWQARSPRDWRRRPPDWPPTRYEEKAIARGERPVYLVFRRCPRAAAPGSAET